MQKKAKERNAPKKGSITNSYKANRDPGKRLRKKAIYIFIVNFLVYTLLLSCVYYKTNRDNKELYEKADRLEEDNARLTGEVESLTEQLISRSASNEEIQSNKEDQSNISNEAATKFFHVRNKNLVYPDKYSITLDGFESDQIDKNELIRELGDFGYEHGIEINSAKVERTVTINVPDTKAFTMSINGYEEEVIDCICYKSGGIIILYDGEINLSIDENEDNDLTVTLTPTVSPTPTPKPTSTPTTSTPQNSRENAQTAQIEHIYDPETLSINDIPNGLYEAILDVEEMRDAIYQYMYANHIYDGEASIDEDYSVNGPYYDFKVTMSNDSRDIYVRYDSRSDKYYCGFNEF